MRFSYTDRTFEVNDRNPTILERVNRHKRCLFRGCARRRAFIMQTRTIILSLNRRGFGGTAIDHFLFRNNETEDMLVYQNNPVGVELFSYVNTFVGFMLGTEISARPAK